MWIFTVVAIVFLGQVSSSLQDDTGTNLTFVISGTKLPSGDDYSKTDGFVKVYTKDVNGELERLGTTDIIRDEENPEWDNVFWVEWKNGTGQKLHFMVKDHDVLDTDDELGEGTIDIDTFVANNQNSMVPLSKGGELIVKGTQPVKFKVYARNVPHKDKIYGELSSVVSIGSEAHSDAYVKVYWRRGKEGADHQFGTSSVIDNEENPNWDETFEFDNYQKGTDQYLYFKVKDQDTLSRNERIGDLLVEADAFVAGGKKFEANLNNSDGRATLTIVPV